MIDPPDETAEPPLLAVSVVVVAAPEARACKAPTPSSADMRRSARVDRFEIAPLPECTDRFNRPSTLIFVGLELEKKAATLTLVNETNACSSIANTSK
jgi:hypothetical protein